MPTNHQSALEIVHRLLFRALIEIRAQGHEQKNKAVFHLADLFHNTVLEMENAAKGGTSYEEVFRLLEAKAREKGCEKWLCLALSEIEDESRARSGKAPSDRCGG